MVLMQQVHALKKTLQEQREGKARLSLVKRSLNKRVPPASPSRLKPPSPRQQALRRPSASFTAATLNVGAVVNSEVCQGTGSGSPTHGGLGVRFADHARLLIGGRAHAADSIEAAADQQPGLGECPMLTVRTRLSLAGFPCTASSSTVPSSGTKGKEGKGGECEVAQCRARPSLSLRSIQSPSENR